MPEFTQYDIARELARLSSILETKSNTAEAKAAEHAKMRQLPEWEREMQTTRSGRHFAKIAALAAELLGPKGKKGTSERPTWEAYHDYAKVKYPDWPASDIQSSWDHYEKVGWVSGRNLMPIKKWEQAAGTSYKVWKEKHPVAAPAKPANGDPEGWREWIMKKAKRPYQEYRYAMEWLKAEFRKAAK